MEIKIDSITIDEQKLQAAIKLEGLISSREFSNHWDFCRKLEAMISDRLVENYLAENADKILSSVNVQNVVNAMVMKAADRFGK
jgi:hypothetical protein